MKDDEVPNFREIHDVPSLAKNLYSESFEACETSEHEVPICYGNDRPVQVLVHRPPDMPKFFNTAIVCFHRGFGIAGTVEMDQEFFAHLATVT